MGQTLRYVFFSHFAFSALSASLALAGSATVAPPVVASLTATPLPLPGSPGQVRMDYLAYDAKNRRLWIPAGNTGNVNVIEIGSGKLTSITGFATAEQDSPRGKRTVGPSAATVGAGAVYVGNRALSQVCTLDGKTLKQSGCVTLPASPDGLAYVATTKEIWVTTPRDQSLTFLDVTHSDAPVVKGKLALSGKPEGYAVDPGRGLFYTNLEDQDQTLAIDVRTRKIVATWKPGCSPAEPQGLALDVKRRLLFVACSDHTVALDVGAADASTALRGQIATGDGVDAIDYDPVSRLLYAPSGKTAKLSVIRVGDKGTLTLIATAPTADGARGVVVDDAGTAYVSDSAGGRLLVVRPAPDQTKSDKVRQ